MAELTPNERLQPALLDRLTDQDPESQVESRDERVIPMKRLRQSVIRDLEWLFNTAAFFSFAQGEEHPEVATSVLNYGVPSFAGVQATGLHLRQVERAIRDAIWAFEPRLLRDSVEVSAVASDSMSRRAVAFDISARLWAEPVPIEMFLRTEIDLETGGVAVADSGRGGSANAGSGRARDGGS
ncbi:MAG: type VI secretion system baseplate subunit TssE [bacterium]|nr:type VI secretion system baseplate subunit TssE [bacterium]